MNVKLKVSKKSVKIITIGEFEFELIGIQTQRTNEPQGYLLRPIGKAAEILGAEQ